MSRISTHVLDTARGKPAAGIPVRLQRRQTADSWRQVGSGQTDQDGRCVQLLPAGESLPEGVYRLVLDTGTYFAAQNTVGLYPVVEITFAVRHGESDFHLPLLLSANGYTTYRGS
jgi:5-hydroxyisourate hydrolase